MPRFAEDLDATGFVINQHHLDLVVVTLGEEDVAVDGEVATNLLGLEGESASYAMFGSLNDRGGRELSRRRGVR
ncbi:MAG: hypothetical protein WCA22_16760 [Candidatus Binatus sp.]